MHRLRAKAKPELKVTQEEITFYITNIAIGLGIEEQLTNAEDCLEDTSTLLPQFQEAFTALEFDEDKLAAWFMTTLAIGNVTEWYQNCYNGSIDSLFDLYNYIVTYESFVNYLLFWMLNLVSQSLTMMNWTEKIQIAKEQGDEETLVQIYAQLFKLIFFFEYDPDALNFDNFIIPEDV